MKKKGLKARAIKFYSKKNEQIIVTYSNAEKEYLRKLDVEEHVKSYTTNFELDCERIKKLKETGIRKAYFDISWMTDLKIINNNGSIAVREFTSKEDLMKKATIEKLELSRRYWNSFQINDWKIVLQGGD